jgi:hypothetical protein
MDRVKVARKLLDRMASLERALRGPAGIRFEEFQELELLRAQARTVPRRADKMARAD